MLLHIHYARNVCAAFAAPVRVCVCVSAALYVMCVCVSMGVCIKIVAENIKPRRSKLKTCIEIKLVKGKAKQSAGKENVWQLFR